MKLSEQIANDPIHKNGTQKLLIPAIQELEAQIDELTVKADKAWVESAQYNRLSEMAQTIQILRDPKNKELMVRELESDIELLKEEKAKWYGKYLELANNREELLIQLKESESLTRAFKQLVAADTSMKQALETIRMKTGG